MTLADQSAHVVSDGARLLLRHPPYLYYMVSRSFSRFASQIAAVAVGWQIYEMTGSAFQLGMVGLAQFAPMLALVFFAGHIADRYDRRRVVMLCQLLQGVTAVLLAWGTYAGWITAPQIFVALVVIGAATAFEAPAGSALLPGVVPEGHLQKATALSTGVFQVAMICGPALGGILYALSPSMPYVLMAMFWIIGALLNLAIKLAREVAVKDPPSLRTLFAGVTFVRSNPNILGTISLDLFAVLLGGATALLPIYARDILQTGPWGLGVMRAAPAVGALLTTIVLTRWSINRRVGMRMFQAVIIFGLATTVFAVSQWLWLSVIALAVLGAADTVSVVIRFSLVQLATPDEMRGRVGAVNYLFINTSNQLGQFESGVTAALFGTVPAALIGGLGTVAIALIWMKLFPTLREMERLE
ncbi:MFS transporter [Tardiphaga sp.]|jgi:MFS family permease|uniref:MFS transporter n=1 Tax=Tardiphaga sp. TaxID=1926292 RepID=UPI0037DA4FB9